MPNTLHFCFLPLSLSSTATLSLLPPRHSLPLLSLITFSTSFAVLTIFAFCSTLLRSSSSFSSSCHSCLLSRHVSHCFQLSRFTFPCPPLPPILSHQSPFSPSFLFFSLSVFPRTIFSTTNTSHGPYAFGFHFHLHFRLLFLATNATTTTTTPSSCVVPCPRNTRRFRATTNRGIVVAALPESRTLAIFLAASSLRQSNSCFFYFEEDRRIAEKCAGQQREVKQRGNRKIEEGIWRKKEK